MPELRILSAAAEEAEAAIRWYEFEQPELGEQLRATFDAALDPLEARTFVGSSMPGPIGRQGVRRLVLRRFPYSIVFIPSESTITILAFAHHSRRPGYWRSRGPKASAVPGHSALQQAQYLLLGLGKQGIAELTRGGPTWNVHY